MRYVAAVLDELTYLTTTETRILVALADFASDDTRECWPSIATISRRARCDRRTAQRRLRALSERGLIDIATGGHQYGRNTASRYRLKFDYHGELVRDVGELSTRAAQDRPRGGIRSDKGGIRCLEGRHGAAPSVIEPSLNQRGAKSAANKDASARAAAALSDAELDERAEAGKMTAAEEYEREHRRRFRQRRA
jgi:hypothetical protein